MCVDNNKSNSCYFGGVINDRADVTKWENEAGYEVSREKNTK